jgi:hypothetical protein
MRTEGGTLNRKAFVVAVIIAAMSSAGVAGSSDNTTGNSYFEGVWSGTWDMGQAGVDVTITIGQKNEKGANKTTYAYGWGKTGTGGTIPPGSFVVYGREHEGAFGFWWKDKQGTKTTVTLKKYKEDVVKARYDREGQSISNQRPYYEAILNRK